MEDGIKQKFMEMQELQKQVGQLKEQMDMLDQQLNEMRTTKESLEELKKGREGDEMLVPVANGMFAKVVRGKTDHLIVNVGAGAAIPKTIDEAKDLVQKQEDKVTQFRMQLTQNMQHMTQIGMRLEKEMQEAMVDMQQSSKAGGDTYKDV